MARGKTRKTPAQRAAERAIMSAQKPRRVKLAISDRHKEAGRSPGRPVCGRLRQISILPDVIDRIKDGWPDIEVARFIHMEGYLKDVDMDCLRKEVRRYRTQVMSPSEVAERRISQGVMQAAHQLQMGINEVQKLKGLYEQQERMIATAMQVFESIVQNPQQAGSTVGSAGDSPGDAPAEDVPRRAIEAAGLSLKEMRAYLMMSGDAIKNITKLMDTARKTALTSAQVKALLDVGTGDNDVESEDVIEARVTAYSKRRFVGHRAAQKVLADPAKRTKIVTLFQKIITDRKLHRDLEAAKDDPSGESPEVIETTAEPAEQTPPPPDPTDSPY